MPDIRVELPGGDVDELLPLLDGAVFANLSPGVDTDEVPSRSGLGELFGNRGPVVPLATWTPGEIGLQHAAGQRTAKLLGERGCAVPEGWYVVSDHPKRGLVLRTYQAPSTETVPWLVQAATVLCPLPIVGPWVALVRSR
ncbi:MAG: hypothetical protein Q8K58_07405 [Acidimicrobiales bacterium]|nr:hypothetical protein [Acidimicrobiales bacterium]